MPARGLVSKRARAASMRNCAPKVAESGSSRRMRSRASAAVMRCTSEMGVSLPFMLMVPRVRAEKRSLIPGVTHEDGTGRVQTLTAELNGRFHGLVERFGRITGVPIVVNTSFNVRGEPMVCTPEDAFRTFPRSSQRH